MIPAYIIVCHTRLRSIAEAAHRKGGDFQLFRYKLDNAIDALANEFGDSAVINTLDPSQVVSCDLKDSESSGTILVKLAREVIKRMETGKKSATTRRSKRPCGWLRRKA